MTRLSIALATWNGAAFLQEQLDSLAAQSRLPDEVVISDDGSTDETLALAERWGRNQPFDVRIDRNTERLGFVANFSRALERCTGDLVFLCDQDDLWLPSKLERVAAIFAAEPGMVAVMNDAELVGPALERSGRTQLQALLASGLSERFYIIGCCSAFRRCFLELALPVPADVKGHDLYLNSLARELQRLTLTRDVLQLFRRHQDNASQFAGSDPRRSLRQRIRARLVPADVRSGLASLAALDRAMVERLEARSELASLLAGRSSSEAATRLRARANATTARMDLCSLPRTKRSVMVIRHLASGGYAKAGSDWKSAVADLVRP